jgi:hypothetical protein
MEAIISIKPSSGVLDPAPVDVSTGIDPPSRSTIMAHDRKPLDPKNKERYAFLVGLASRVTERQVPKQLAAVKKS